MAKCYKFSITNITTTWVTFGYHNCDSNKIVTQNELFPGQTKFVWAYDNTVNSAFGSGCYINNETLNPPVLLSPYYENTASLSSEPTITTTQAPVITTTTTLESVTTTQAPVITTTTQAPVITTTTLESVTTTTTQAPVITTTTTLAPVTTTTTIL